MRLDRIEKEEEVLVDVIHSSNAELVDTFLACRTVDVSENGMKVAMDMDVPLETRLGLRLDFTSELYRLEGEVRWINESGGFIGLQLDEESADYINWTRMFELDLIR